MQTASRPVDDEGTRHIPLAPFYLRDTRTAGDQYYITITAMDSCKHKSLEELRLEDYRLGTVMPQYGLATAHPTGNSVPSHIMETPSRDVHTPPRASHEGRTLNHAPSSSSRSLMKAPPMGAVQEDDGVVNTPVVRQIKPPPPPFLLSLGQQSTHDSHAVERSMDPPLPSATNPLTTPCTSTMPSLMSGTFIHQSTLILKASPMKASPTRMYDSRQTKAPLQSACPLGQASNVCLPPSSTDPSAAQSSLPRKPPSCPPPPPPTTPPPPAPKLSGHMGRVSPVAPPPPPPQLSHPRTVVPPISPLAKALPPTSSPPSTQGACARDARRSGPPSSYKPPAPRGSPPPLPPLSSFSAPPSSTQERNDGQGTLSPVSIMTPLTPVPTPQQNRIGAPMPSTALCQSLRPSGLLREDVIRPLLPPQSEGEIASAAKVSLAAQEAPPASLPSPSATRHSVPEPSRASSSLAPINRSTKPPPPCAPRLAASQGSISVYALHRSPQGGAAHNDLPSPVPPTAPPRQEAASTAFPMLLQPAAPEDKRTPAIPSKPASPPRPREETTPVMTALPHAIANPALDRDGAEATLQSPLHENETRSHRASCVALEEPARHPFVGPIASCCKSYSENHAPPLDAINPCELKAAPSPFPGVFSNYTQPLYKQPMIPFLQLP